LLCYVTDRHALPATKAGESLVGLARKIEEVSAAGVDWVQIREKDLPATELSALTRQTLQAAARSSGMRQSTARVLVRVLVNDRLDVAIAEHAGGVHLGEKSIPVAEAKRLAELRFSSLPSAPPFLVGASCHSLESAQNAQRSGADYIFFGPVFSTPSKEQFGPFQGIERLAQVCRSLSIPVLAIGGITPDNAESCILAGAAGIAAIRLFQDARDPSSTIQQLHQRITGFRRRPPADRKTGH
jgi:thiamine-phosphate pyrophosphorylase